jgi:hypothetical protein
MQEILEERTTGNRKNEMPIDIYFSADVETDGPIPGPFSLLSFALVCVGTFDGESFDTTVLRERLHFYCELKPISERFQEEALRVNKLDRHRLTVEGKDPRAAMTAASRWVSALSGNYRPVLVAYPLSFDWSWLFWYFIMFSEDGSPFSYSHCFDLKTAFATKAHKPISQSGRAKLPQYLKSDLVHSHNALDDAIEQAEIFAKVFRWSGDDRG